MGTLVGYMRVSTKDQRLDLQRDALVAAGVQERYLYEDRVSGSKQARPGLTACLKALHPGDTLVVWKLDRLARSLIHLLEVMKDFQEQQITLRVLDGLGAHLNVATAEGKLFLSMLGAFAEFEREMIRERVIAGLEAARARGHHGGRKPKLTADDEAFVRDMVKAGMPITKIAARLKCSRHTVYKALAQARVVAAEAAKKAPSPCVGDEGEDVYEAPKRVRGDNRVTIPLLGRRGDMARDVRHEHTTSADWRSNP